MKKFFIVITLVVFIAGLINEQDADGTTGDTAGSTDTTETAVTAAAPAAAQMFESDYYKVYSEISMTHAQQTAEKLDAYFELYNSYFHFDPSALTTKMKVKLLANQESYKKYLARTVPDVKNSFVYLQYKNYAEGYDIFAQAYTNSTSYRFDGNYKIVVVK